MDTCARMERYKYGEILPSGKATLGCEQRDGHGALAGACACGDGAAVGVNCNSGPFLQHKPPAANEQSSDEPLDAPRRHRARDQESRPSLTSSPHAE